MATEVTPAALCCKNEVDEDVRSLRATAQQQRGGYDCEFVKPPPEEFPQTDCPVCLLILREPYQVSCCGNSYCEPCVKRVRDHDMCCPTCNQTGFTFFPDKRLKRSLYTLNVYCCHRKVGCEWVGELRALDGHLNLQSSPQNLFMGCQFSEVNCAYCVQPFQRRYVQAHQSDGCVRRPYTCGHCNQYVSTFEDVLQNHWPVCPFFSLSCPNSCELVLQRQELEHHINEECPLTLVECQFLIVGCHVRLPKRDMPSHISDNLTEHISLMQVHLTTHAQKSALVCMPLMVDMIQKIAKDNANIQNELHETQETIQQRQQELQEARDQLCESLESVVHFQEMVTFQGKMIQSVTKELEKDFSFKVTLSEQRMQTELCKLQATLTHQHKELTDRLSSNELKIAATQTTQNSKILECIKENRELQRLFTEQEKKGLENEAKIMKFSKDIPCKITASEQSIKAQLTKHQRMLERVTFTGTLPFEFTMTNFDQHKQASDIWYSPSFYTHTHGYKMCIRVDANGWGPAKGTHLSVFGYLMQGEFDNDLQWPFQGSITIQLLNMLENSSVHEHVINFAETTNPNVVSRVTAGERAQSGQGKPLFILHTQLLHNSDRNCQYLKANEVKFRVSKATNLDPTTHIHKRCLRLESFVQAIEPQICVVPVVFVLTGFQQLKKENEVWFSPAFYTHPRGYRLCLQVLPNGHNSGLGTHVSIYTCIMRGAFDSSLKWPLRGNVTVQILNQMRDNNHHTNIILYSDQQGSDSIDGRGTDRERSAARGVHQFLPHTSLSNIDRNILYLQGDTLRIRMSAVDLRK